MKDFIKFPTMLVVTLILGAGAVLAQDFQRGVDAYNAGDYTTALKDLKPLAGQGDTNAQSYLAWLYEAGGNGVTQDFKEAMKWYRQAAKQGDANAQLLLGNMYEFGKGANQDNILAHMWFSLAVKNGEELVGVIRKNAIERDLTSVELAKAQSMAEECMSSNFKNCGY
jgi:uncharacterized protein